MNEKTKWIHCPVCGKKTRDRIREDTVLKNYPLYCPKCKQETLIEVKKMQITAITEPDTLDAEPMNLWEITVVGSVLFYIDFNANPFYGR